MRELIEKAETNNKWEKHDMESLQNMVARMRQQKAFDEVKIQALMPEYRSMAKLHENSDRLKFLA